MQVIIADGQVTRSVDQPPGTWSPQEQATRTAIEAARQDLSGFQCQRLWDRLPWPWGASCSQAWVMHWMLPWQQRCSPGHTFGALVCPG